MYIYTCIYDHPTVGENFQYVEVQVCGHQNGCIHGNKMVDVVYIHENVYCIILSYCYTLLFAVTVRVL